MALSSEDKIIIKQKDGNIPANAIAYIGRIERKSEIHAQLRTYIDGYREALDAVFQKYEIGGENGHIWIQDSIVFPLVYLHRHCVELELKHLYCLTDFGVKLLKSILDENAKCGHNLAYLWNKIKNHIEERAKRVSFDVDVNSITNYVNQIDSLDRDSFKFRYPMSKKYDGVFHEVLVFDLKYFHSKMIEFHEYMGYIFDNLINQVDEWELDETFVPQFISSLHRNASNIELFFQYEVQKETLQDKVWLSMSDIPENEHRDEEIKFCYELDSDVKKLVLILFWSIDIIRSNHLVNKESEEWLDDILKVCYNVSQNNMLSSNNSELSIYLHEKMYAISKKKDDILNLVHRIILLTNTYIGE